MTRFPALTAALVSISLLGGCVEAGARAVALGTSLADAGQALVSENIADRQWVRQQCRSILEQQIASLRAEGKEEDARALLKASYPRLITEKLAAKIMADIEAGQPINLPPDICGPGEVTVDLGRPLSQ